MHGLWVDGCIFLLMMWGYWELSNTCYTRRYILGGIRLKSGFIYPLVNGVFNSLRFLSMVELFKQLSEKMAGKDASKKRRGAFSRMSVDVFIVLVAPI